ncbi:MAG: hypothetical protein IRZ33_00980 [Alicyclobacillaceae bacterium]|nr:hypothetical protein [Alicyclobacillaceae bacterium]
MAMRRHTLSRATLVLASAAMMATFSAGTGAPAMASSANTLTIGQAFPFQNEFIPFIATDLYTNNIWSMAFDSLLNFNHKLDFIPWLAKSWKWSKDHKTLTMWLQPNAKWSDGQPITSDDVLLTMDFLASKAYNTTLKGEYESLVDPIVGAQEIVKGKKTSFAQTGGFTKINDKEFQIHLDSPDAAVLYSDIAAIVPLPSHILKKIPFQNWGSISFNKKPTVVDGPYQFVQVNGTDNVVFKANPLYWKGKPKIENLVFKTDNPDVAPGLLRNGSVDFQINGLKASDVAKLKTLKNVYVKALPDNGWYYLGAKLNKLPELKDYRVREAFEYALNRQAMVQGIMKGYGSVVSGPLPDVSWAAATPKDGLNPYPYNVAKANQLLDEAGWRKDANGNRIDPVTKQPAEFQLTYPIDPVREAIAVSVKQSFQALGIQVDLNTPLDILTFYDKVQKDDPSIQLFVAGWELSVDPDPRSLWGSQNPMNYERWVDATNDKLIDDTWQAKAFDPAYRKKALIKWQLYVNKQMPVNFLFSKDNLYAVNKRVHIPDNDWVPTGHLPLNPQEWTVSQ